MKKINIINMHILNRCNYQCKFCFAKYEKEQMTLENAKSCVDNIVEFFKTNSIEKGRINLAGGEPLLYKYIYDLIDYIYKKNVKVSLITNGSLLTKEVIDKIKDKVSMVGISLHSLNPTTNRKIGACHNATTINRDNLLKLSSKIKESGISLKFNVVVTKDNIDEKGKTLRKFFNEIKPDKIKIIQARYVEGINKRDVIVTDCEFEEYCKGYKGVENIQLERAEDGEASYVIINPSSELVQTKDNEEKVIGSLLKETLEDLIAKSDIDIEKFQRRYGNVINGPTND